MYVVYVLDPGLDWASIWPSTPRAFPVATPHSVSCCLSQMDRVSHLSPSLLSGWLLTNVQINNTTTLYDTHEHTYTVYITSALLFFFLPFVLHLFHFSWQAGWPRPFRSDTCRMLGKCNINLQKRKLPVNATIQVLSLKAHTDLPTYKLSSLCYLTNFINFQNKFNWSSCIVCLLRCRGRLPDTMRRFWKV